MLIGRSLSFAVLVACGFVVMGCAGPKPAEPPYVATDAQIDPIVSHMPPYPTIGTIIRHDARLDALLPDDATIDVLAEGFVWAEGPVWVKDHLLFSDIPPNAIYKWHPRKGASVWMRPSGYTGDAPRTGEPGTNGLTLDHDGKLVAAAHGDRQVFRLDCMWFPNGGRTVLARHYEGKRFNSPNDVVYHTNGDLYFTDPPYGLQQRMKDPAKELDYQGVYRLDGEDNLTLLTKEVTRPNGIAFSPDYKTLYVASSDPNKAVWHAFPVMDDGTLGEGHVLVDFTARVGQPDSPGLPDGLKVDKQGNLWATGPGGVHVFAPDGTHLGTIATGQKTANVAWGNDGSVLYITADMYLARVQTATKGAGW